VWRRASRLRQRCMGVLALVAASGEIHDELVVREARVEASSVRMQWVPARSVLGGLAESRLAGVCVIFAHWTELELVALVFAAQQTCREATRRPAVRTYEAHGIGCMVA